MYMATQSQGQNSPGEDDLDALERGQIAPSTRQSQDYVDSDVSFDEEGYEISQPRQERPMAQQDPPVGRPLPSES
jgi:hypothetical protein